ncbi:MAG: addiction module protein [Candidatus Sumerlaeota bacterium]|nr:addiction module protein [Candidatus Sumerlaeota bacterium]
MPKKESQCDKILKKAQTLAPADRLELVDGILAGLHHLEPSWERAWAREAESRVAAYRAGKIKAVPLSVVIKKIKQKQSNLFASSHKDSEQMS